MQKAKKNSRFLICGLVFALICFFALSIIPTNTISALAATDVFQNTLTGVTMDVTAYGAAGTVESTTKDDVSISGSEINTKTIDAKSYAWSNVKYFKIAMSGLNETNLGTKLNGATYEYSYSVTYFPATINNGNLAYDSAAILSKTFYSFNSTTTSDIKNEVYFFIDNNESSYKTTGMNITANAETVFAETDYASQGGWGTYVFTFNCDNKENSGSFIYELVPTSLAELEAEQLTVTYQIVPSEYSINNAYLFSVNEKFQYVNREKIVWNIRGTGSDGTKYSLFDEGSSDVTALYPATGIKNTGATFKFDKNIQGKWKAFVSIKENGIEKYGESVEVSTIKPFSTTAIIIIVSCVTVVAVAIVAVIIALTIKKERTW